MEGFASDFLLGEQPAAAKKDIIDKDRAKTKRFLFPDIKSLLGVFAFLPADTRASLIFFKVFVSGVPTGGKFKNTKM